MQTRTYSVIGNKTPADVIANNVETLETGYDLDSAKAAAASYQRNFGYVAAWIEEEETKPRIVRTVEQDRSGVKYTVVTIDGWAI